MRRGVRQGTTTGACWGCATNQHRRLPLPILSTPERTKLSHTLGRALADLLRARNHQNGVAVAYKAFYHRLARRRFATFMRGMLARMLDQVRVQSLTPDGQTAVARFTDIVIHHGSSFALKAALSGTCPGQFTTAAHSGSFIVRLTRSYDPSIRTAWVEGQRPPPCRRASGCRASSPSTSASAWTSTGTSLSGPASWASASWSCRAARRP